jgi:hypothetical protein
MVLILPF